MGLHKTATTSFQSTCAKNLDKLLTQGYFYPSFKYNKVEKGRDQFNHSGPIVSCFGPDPESYGFNIESKVKNIGLANAEYLKQLKNALSVDKDLIISGEGISSLDVESLQKLKTFLESTGAELIPLVCVRSPYAFHCSSTQTVVKRGRYVDLKKFRRQKGCITNIKSVFKNTKFVSFNTACKHSGGPVNYLLECCGIDAAGFSFETRNEGRSNEFVRLQNALNKQQPIFVDKKLNPKHFKLTPTEGNKFLLTKEELAAVKGVLNQENQFFKEALGEEFCDEKIEHSEPFSLEELVAFYPEFFFNRTSNFKGKVESVGVFKKLSQGWKKRSDT